MEFNDLLPYLVQKYHEWLLEQHDLHIASARPLSNEERTLFRDYYDQRILDLVRIATVDHVSNPGFYSELAELGISSPMDLSQSAGLTLMDCILICKYFESFPPSWNSILFHEMVHVVQYDILGSKRLLELYLAAWVQNEYQYNSIPFERQAFSLEGRFNRHEPPFSVRQIVEQELKEML